MPTFLIRVMIKFQFKIRSRNGVVVDCLNIQGRDRADAERKLKQMYPNCEILECSETQANSQYDESVDVGVIISLIAKEQKREE